MRTRGLLLLLTMIGAVLLSLAAAAGALAAPQLTSVTPSSASASASKATELKINGQDLTEFSGTPTVSLQQTAWPYDSVSAYDVSVVGMLGGDYIDCYVNTHGETAGTYDVVVTGTWLVGQPVQTLTLSGAFQITGSSPVTALTIASLSPKTKQAGEAAFTLTVNGANFGTSPTVYWNGSPLATKPGGMPNPTATCSATVPAALIASPGTYMITVSNGSATSSSAAFTVTASTPVLSSLSPPGTWARLVNPPLVTLAGSNFQSSAQVLVNGAVHASTYKSATQLTVQLTATDIAYPTTLNFAVRNSSGGALSSTLPFTLNADTTSPVTTISGADAAWHNTPVTLTVSATDAGGPGVQKTYYGIGVSPTSVLAGSTVTVPAPAGGAGDGQIVVQAYSVDNCANVEAPPATATVNICTKGPETSVSAPAGVKKGKTCTIKYECDSVTPQCTATMKIYKSNGSVAKSFSLGTQTSDKQYAKSFTCNLAPGNYKVKVFATDAAGNAQSSMQTDAFSVTK